MFIFFGQILIFELEKIDFFFKDKFMPAPLAPILVYFMIFDQYNFIDGWYTYERNCIENIFSNETKINM